MYADAVGLFWYAGGLSDAQKLKLKKLCVCLQQTTASFMRVAPFVV